MLATLRERLVPPLNRDGRLVIAASAVRALDYGFLSIFLGVYLSLLDFSALQAGLVFGSNMAGGALSNVVFTWRGDAIGRRRMLVAMSGLMALGGALLLTLIVAGVVWAVRVAIRRPRPKVAPVGPSGRLIEKRRPRTSRSARAGGRASSAECRAGAPRAP